MKKTAISSVIITASAIIFPAVLCLADGGNMSAPHSPRDGDRLHPNISFSRQAIAIEDSASRMVGIVSALFSPDDNADAFVYVDGDTISYVQAATKHRFVAHGDTLAYIGYENRASEFRTAEPVDAFSLDSGEVSFRRDWKATQSLHGRMLLKNARGTSHTSAERGWTLVCDGDTIRDVTYTKWTLDMAYLDTDSISAEMPDSVTPDNISDLELPPLRQLALERLMTQRELWTTGDARYPVLERSTVSLIRSDEDSTDCDTIPLSVFAMHYPADFQYADTGEQPVRNKPADTMRENMPWLHYGENIPGITVKEPTVAGDAINVAISSETEDTGISLTLYTDSGIRLSETIEVTNGAIPQTHSIPVPAGIKGVVILLIESTSGSTSRKIIL